MSALPHPELDFMLPRPEDRSVTTIEDLTVEPCSPGCTLLMAQRLWPAWRDLTQWRDQVDAELPGEMTRLMPELWRMWRGLDDADPDPVDAAPAQSSDSPPIDDALDDGLTNEPLRLVLEDLCRAVFALGAGWAQNRTTAQ
jgi:hypothetical protein